MQMPKLWVILGLTLLLSLAGLAGLIGRSSPAQADAGLPSRETPIPDRSDDDDDDDGGPSGPVGAYIVLQAQNLPPGAWGVVQWQDSIGVWQTVEGWQGPLPDNSRWWVAAKDFGTGPFRWTIFSGPGGELLKASGPFILPAHAHETITVYVVVR